MQSETPLERFRRRCGVRSVWFWGHHRKTPFWKGYWKGRNVGYKNGLSVGRRGGYKSGPGSTHLLVRGPLGENGRLWFVDGS